MLDVFVLIAFLHGSLVEKGLYASVEACNRAAHEYVSTNVNVGVRCERRDARSDFYGAE